MFKKSKKYNDMQDSTILWRYLSFSKFLDMINTSSLYFCRLDCFEDKLEATQPEGSKEFVRMSENPGLAYERYKFDKQLEIIRSMTYANCWHVNQEENPNMWNNYVMYHGNEGIAIQTTFKKLTQSLKTDRTVTDVRIQYIDYKTTNMDFFMANCADFLVIKDKQFEYENEMRLITLEESYPQYDEETDEISDTTKLFKHKGKKIEVDLNTLIQKIYISPNATERFKLDVQSHLDNCGLKVAVVHSMLKQ